MERARGVFSSRLGFVLAAAGSAVGLGNIWKFPYVTGENGGGAFLLIYLGLAFSVGICVMIAEIAIGRAARGNPVGAFARLRGGNWPLAGYLCVLVAVVILSFYSVVGGWTLSYVVDSLAGTVGADGFGALVSSPTRSLAFHAAFMAMTMGVVALGVRSGIERSARILMPVFFLLLAALVIRSLTLPGGWEGVSYFLAPDFSRVTWDTLHAALSQAFFSLSLGMGAMITYGSYLGREESLPRAAASVTALDSLVAVMAGLLVFPAVFAFGVDQQAGPTLTFVTLPGLFEKMPLGGLFAAAFFFLLAIAALTSAVSILEVVIAHLCDDRGVARKKAVAIAGPAIFLLGAPSALSFGALAGFQPGGRTAFDWMDWLGSSVLLPLNGLLIALFAGWVLGERAIREATADGRDRFRLARAWLFVSRIAAPIAVGWILIEGLV